MIATELFDGIGLVNEDELKMYQFIPYIEGSTKRAPVPSVKKRNSQPLELTHTDISGKMSIPSLGGAEYYAIFFDDCTSISSVYFLRQKCELLSALQKYKALVENESKGKWSMIDVCLDNPGEYKSNEITEYVQKYCVKLEYSPAYASQSNGSSEI